MNRVTLISLAALPSAICTAITTEAEHPNILWLTYEDTSPQFIGCYGNEAAHTPTMDSMFVNGGILFNYAYSNSTVSSASRSCIITGRDVNLLGTGNHRYERKVPADVKGFPYYLRQAGYYTTNNVKTDYNISNSNFINEAWNESSGTAHWRKRPTSSTPFFSVFNVMYSHQSFASRNDESYYISNVFNKLDADRKTDPLKMIVPSFYKDDAEMRGYMTRMQNCINYTDQIFNDRLKELKADGLDQNTIVFMFSDHGEGIPRAKTCAIGMGYRVPFIVWLPEKWKHLNPYITNIINDKQICFEDLAPTILKLVGINPPAEMKGKAFLGADASHSTYVHGSRNRIDDSPGIERSVLKGRYVYTRVFSPYLPTHKNQGYDYNGNILVSIRKNLKLDLLNDIQKEPFLPRTTEYLYDLETDTWETTNLATNPTYAELLTELRTEMIRYTKEIKDLGFMPEFEMQRRSQNITPFEVRNNYDINSILDAALLVGGGQQVLQQQLSLLNSNDPLVRFWAAVGIYNQGAGAVTAKDQVIAALSTETFEGARIELAAFLYKFCNVSSAADVLAQYARGTNELLANDAVTKIQNMGDKISDFKELINEIQPIWATNAQTYSVSPAVNVTQIIINNMLTNSAYSDTIQHNAVYNIKNLLTGGYLGVKDAGQNELDVVNQTLTAGTHTNWKLEVKDNGILLTNQNSNMALSFNSTQLANGAIPFQESYKNEDRQLWTLEKYESGYKMINKVTSKMLQVNGQSKAEGATVAQWDWNGKNHFIWLLEKVPTNTAINQLNVNGGLLKIQSLSPSPAQKSNMLNVLYTLNEAGEVTFSFYDITGKNRYYSKKETQIPGQYTEAINISSALTGGIYLLKIDFNAGSQVYTQTSKIIVQ